MKPPNGMEFMIVSFSRVNGSTERRRLNWLSWFLSPTCRDRAGVRDHLFEQAEFFTDGQRGEFFAPGKFVFEDLAHGVVHGWGYLCWNSRHFSSN